MFESAPLAVGARAQESGPDANDALPQSRTEVQDAALVGHLEPALVVPIPQKGQDTRFWAAQLLPRLAEGLHPDEERADAVE